MASACSGEVTAMEVGSYFVGQYYHLFQLRPECAHHFYTDSSAMMRVDGEMTETANGMMQIHALIMTKSFSSIEIKTAHSLDSWNGGVLVMISGLVRPVAFCPRRKFMQSFFLAPQEKGYFVLNDIFHYLEEEEQQVDHYSTSLLAQSSYETQLNTSTSVVEPASDYMLSGELHSEDYVEYADQDYGHTDHEFSNPVQAEEDDTVDEYIPEPQLDAPLLDETIEENHTDEPAHSFSSVERVVNTTHVSSPVIEEEPVGEPTKHTYASILGVAKGQPARSLPNSAPLNKPVAVASEWQHASQSSAPQAYSFASMGNEKFISESAEEVSAHEDEGDRSVYLGNLPSSISVYDLEEEFKNFGKIRPDGVTIRNRKEAGVFYAFVEFEDALAVQNALKASPLEINGHRIHVEGRRPSSGSSRGRRGRGRGGYQTDLMRGRYGGGSNFGRGGGGSQDDRDYSRSRSNGFHPRAGARQDRGNQYSRNGQNYDAAY